MAPTKDSPSQVTLVNQAKSTPKDVPAIDINTPIKLGESGASVPTTDINAPINIEKVTTPSVVPESNLNAPLKIESQDTLAKDTNSGNKKLLILGILIVVVIIIGIGSFIFLQSRLK